MIGWLPRLLYLRQVNDNKVELMKVWGILHAQLPRRNGGAFTTFDLKSRESRTLHSVVQDQNSHLNSLYMEKERTRRVGS